MPLTQHRFAQYCAYIAKNASAWAGDTLDCEGDVAPEIVARFTDELRERADRIDQRAGRQAPAATVPAPVYKAVEQILDENSAWIARPSDEVTKRVGLAATIAAHTILEKERAELAPPPGATAMEALKAAIEGECDGLAIDDAQATTILAYVAKAERAEDAQPFAWWAETGTAGTGDDCNKLFFMRELAVDHVRRHGGHVVTVYRGLPNAGPAMPTARAFAIVGAICERSFHPMGMAELSGELHGVSLAEMIEAKRVIEAENDKPPLGGTRTIHCVPDDRLIAAAYALANYEPSHGALVSEPDGDGLVKALAIVRLTTAPRMGGDRG
ncbi:hypothetical protein [Chelatococcus asaccharovorans]|uniref:Uncharacterized protein n=1 Tax=Chelatococcus asaccharovorans TaxID=28210 RepID=A0A2V3U2P2_9HYPH|nr:hypothetical protein [Chelatococcus asaccharovorans]MBS7702713.1 hypothetical protein [Chelatococcus asaccharovorans]PXW57005.1 hypothetical protein C7450_10742 [Chelatococcus asaccharovorans]